MRTAHYVPLLSCCLALTASGQVQHALDFDGIDDQVQVFGASSQIVNATSFSLTCWVYPRNAQANWPDMEGFAGFRDEQTCDFYLLQTYGNTLEGRFRNSVNSVFTVDTAVLTMGEWQFLALVYDGQNLAMYRNGVLLKQTPAFGTNVNPSRPLHIGNIPFLSNANFWLDGRVDEVGLWRRGLTQAELGCIMAYGADPADGDLRLYYKMDQGVAAGANGNIANLVDAKGTLNGTFNGLALNGAGSNFVDGAPLAGSLEATICQDEFYDLNGQLIGTSGTYVASFPLPNGCDSLETVRISVIPVNVAVMENGPVLTAFDATGPWQWVDCDAGFAPIPGADQQTFVAGLPGNYAVIVESFGCADTSACISVGTVGVASPRADGWLIMHDVVQDRLLVDVGSPTASVSATLVDAMGRSLMRRDLPAGRSEWILGGLAPGAYHLVLIAGSERRVHRFLRP